MTLERVEIEVPSSRPIPAGRAVRVEASVPDFGPAVMLAVGLVGTDAGAVLEQRAVQQLHDALARRGGVRVTVLGVDRRRPRWVSVVQVVSGLGTDVVVTASGQERPGAPEKTHCTVAVSQLRRALQAALVYLARMARV